MRTEVFKDTRLLDALEYIDDEYIASAARYKMKYTEETHEHKMTWRTPLKHWKQFVALAACLILLSAAFPTIVRFVGTAIDFLAGRGGGTTESSEYLNTESTDPMETEAQMIDTGVQTVETEIEAPETEPPYRSPILDAYNDMSVTEIYKDILNGNWVVMTEGWTKSHKIELWDEFFDTVDQGESATVLFAQYTTWEDLDSQVQEISDPEEYPTIVLTELCYNGKTFMMTDLIIEPTERTELYHSLPYLLPHTVNGYTYYYLGQYQDSKPPDWSLFPHGYSVYVFLDRSRKALE